MSAFSLPQPDVTSIDFGSHGIITVDRKANALRFPLSLIRSIYTNQELVPLLPTIDQCLNAASKVHFVWAKYNDQKVFVPFISVSDANNRDFSAAFPMFDSLDSVRRTYIEWAHLFPNLFRVEEKAITLCRFAVDDQVIAQSAKRSNYKEKYLTGSRAQKTRLTVVPAASKFPVINVYTSLIPANNPLNLRSYQTLSELKRITYPEYGCLAQEMATVTSLLGLSQRNQITLDLTVDGQWLASLVVSITDHCVYVPFIVLTQDPELRRLYSPYNCAHYAVAQWAVKNNIPFIDFGIEFEYKRRLGFPSVTLPSIRLSDELVRLL